MIRRKKWLKEKTIFLSVFTVVAACCALFPSLTLAAQPSPPTDEDPASMTGPILQTRWHQRGLYNSFTPVDDATGNHERLGCWSVAIAQMINHLQLQPRGHQYYEGTHYTIEENMNYRFNWSKIANELSDTSPTDEVLETALFCYLVSVTVRADFGGEGGYLGNSDPRRFELKRHFPCTTQRVSTGANTNAEIEDFIVAELTAGRPLMLYIYPHAMVIDGYRRTAQRFDVHIKFGWPNPANDGWYDLWDEIHTSLVNFPATGRWVMSIKPNTDDVHTKIEADPGTRGPLMTSTWGPKKDYALYAPSKDDGTKEELGSWSVAIGQMIAHLQLQPHGTQSYTGTHYVIDQSYNDINWQLVAASLKSSGTTVNSVETAKAAFYIASIIRRDFGTDGYMGNSDDRRAELHDHFGCVTRRYKTGVHSRRTMERVIRREVRNNRSVMLYVKGQQDLRRAAVIDGFNATVDAKFYVHLNFGEFGNDNGWFAFWDTIKTSHGDFDDPSRWIMTMRRGKT